VKEICYESSIRIQVSGSEDGVEVPEVVGVVLMNVQSPVGILREGERGGDVIEIVLSRRNDPAVDANAEEGVGNDCGISVSMNALITASISGKVGSCDVDGERNCAISESSLNPENER